MSLISGDDPSYVVPDFAADALAREKYDAVAKALLAAAVATALRKLQDEYEFERLRLEANSRAAQTVLVALERHAHSVRSKYARIVPKQRTASGIVRPPTLFFDNLLSMGVAEKYYKQAIEAATLKREAQVKVRTTARDLERHKNKHETAIVVGELEVRKRYKTEAGRAELEQDPRLAAVAAQCAAIERERADYKARLEAGAVSDEELRDRTMALEGYRYLEGDIRGLHCRNESEIHFGELRFLSFRDREDRIWLLEFAPAVLPLTQMRFDIIFASGRYLIQRSPPPARSGEEPKRRKHEGPDPRAYMGVDPVLRLALRDFVAREKAAL